MIVVTSLPFVQFPVLALGQLGIFEVLEFVPDYGIVFAYGGHRARCCPSIVSDLKLLLLALIFWSVLPDLCKYCSLVYYL